VALQANDMNDRWAPNSEYPTTGLALQMRSVGAFWHFKTPSLRQASNR
jgi:hypothetical protein